MKTRAISFVTVCLLIGILTLAILQSNASGVQIADLFQDIKCEIPCWNYLIPGETSEMEALEKAQNKELLNEATHILEHQNYRKYIFNYKNSNVDLVFEENQLRRIEFYRNLDVRLKDVIAVEGEPIKIDTMVDHHHQVCFDSSLYYPARGLKVTVGDCSDSPDIVGDIYAGVPVLTIDYVPVSSSVEEMLTHFQYSKETLELHLNSMQDWDGYGIYR